MIFFKSGRSYLFFGLAILIILSHMIRNVEYNDLFTQSTSASCSKRDHIGTTQNKDYYQNENKVPLAETPYLRAKVAQYEKDADRAIQLFGDAILAGDRVDSALKDMAITMKQQNRVEEAIEAIKSLRHKCSYRSQESLDNILLDLYKKCGRLDDQIAVLRQKLQMIRNGLAFNGKRTKTARSRGRKYKVSIEQEETRLLGNLGWALMQNGNYKEAEEAYRNALHIQPDNNKMCNLGICLMKQGRIIEARNTLMQVESPASTSNSFEAIDPHLKAFLRAQEMLQDIESNFTGEEENNEDSTNTNVTDDKTCSACSHEDEDEKNKRSLEIFQDLQTKFITCNRLFLESSNSSSLIWDQRPRIDYLIRLSEIEKEKNEDFMRRKDTSPRLSIDDKMDEAIIKHI